MMEQKPGKKKSPIKSALFIVGFIVLLAIVVRSMMDAYALGNTTKKEDNTASLPVVTVPLATLESDYTADADSATSKYKDKMVLVTGTIKEIDKYRSGDSYLIFQSPLNPSKIEIECIFKNEKVIDSLTKGSIVTIKGKPDFKTDKLYMQKAELVK